MLRKIGFALFGIGALVLWTVGGIIEAVKDRLDTRTDVW